MRPIKAWQLAVLILICGALLAACGPAPTPEPTLTPTPEAVPIIFATQPPPPEDLELMEDEIALTGGLYIDDDTNCILVRDDLGTIFTPIWPNGYAPGTASDGTIVVYDGERNIKGRVQRPIAMTGSDMSLEEYNQLYGEDLAMGTCPDDRYWVVSRIFNSVPQ